MAGVPKGAKKMTVKAKGFLLVAEPLANIAEGHVGAGSFQREMLQLSKIDELLISVADIRELNPLAELKVVVDIAKLAERDPE